MELSPIGRVRSVRGETSEIEVFPEYLDGLYRVEEHERLMVLFLFDRSSAVKLRVNPRGDLRNPLVGVFSSRSPDRPNHIGGHHRKAAGCERRGAHGRRPGCLGRNADHRHQA